MPSTVPCPEPAPPPIAHRSRLEVDDPQDVRTAAGLRHALDRLEVEGGWSGPAGERLLEALGAHCARLAPVVQRRSGQPPDPHRSDDLTSRAWELLATRPERVVHASNPWGYLTRCLLNAGINAAVADRLMVGDVAIQGGAVPATVQLHRVGEHEHVLDLGLDKQTASDEDSPEVSWGLALRRLHTDLIDADAPAVVTAAAIDRVIDVISANRHGHRESAAKRDHVLVQLGLSTAQIGALVALVAGTRRRGVEESLWFQRHAQQANSDAEISESARLRIDVYVGGFVEPVPVPA